MKTFTRIFRLLILILSISFVGNANGQSVMDPSDPIVNYNSSNPPTQPPYGQIGKWVRTPLLNWNTTSYKCYIYKGFQFRLKFPKTYNPTANDGKKYPVFVFFHGLGETGTIYQNEKQLLHGGQYIAGKVDDGSYDGYLLYPQSGGFWGDGQYDLVKEILEYMFVNNKADPFQVSVDGLSAGGAATWEALIKYPTYFSAAIPLSASCACYINNTTINKIKFTPMWQFQGGLDGSPDPYTSQQVRDAILAAGGNFKYTEYPDQGHGIWNTAWAEPDYFPFLNRAYSSNPWTLFGRTEFCPNDPINVTIGLTPGFDQYEWRKNGNLISGATSNTIQVSGASAIGVYTARVKRGAYWSEWSRTPVEIKIKTPTVPPSISVSGLMSKVIPALDGSNGVTLSVPTGYASYLWQKVGSNTTIGTANTLNATTPGDYKVQVTEQYGCSTNFSDPFTVVDANGPNKPDPAINLLITTLSKTSLRLDWSDNPAPQYNETNFEVYRATQSGGPYTLIGITGADILTFTSTGLNANTNYYYKVRAVNNTGAAAASNTGNGITDADTQAPTAPTNLQITGTTRYSISLSWNASTDDVGVDKYDIYVNSVKAYITSGTIYTIPNLQYGQNYNFAVKARDVAGNVSPFSNQVTGQPLLNGLPYKYYTFAGTWNNLPDFTTLTPDATGIMPNVALTPRTQNDNFAFLWEGYINIPVSGTYYFRTNSDDGSRLWLGALNGSASPYSFSGTPLVNNDGLHGPRDITSSAISLTAGVYPIAMAFYEQGGGEVMTVSWRTPQTGSSYVTIPNSAFADQPVNNGTAPADPSGLSASAVSFNQINLSWTDNSNNETGFEIWRSIDPQNGFATVGLAPANATSYSDNNSLAPNTTYYYQIRAIGQYGESQLIGNSNSIQANWKFNNNYDDASGNGKTLSPNNSPTFSTDRQEGSHSVDLNGSNEDITVNTSSGDYIRGGYNAKTVAFWMRADVTSSGSTRLGIFDFGGSDDGLAMYIQSNNLYAGVAGNNTRRSISASYSSTGWNHIALVYSASSLRLYVNGAQVAANTSLGFTSVGSTSSGSIIGDDNGSTAFSTSTSYFGQFNGRFDDFYVIDKALSVSEITKIMNQQSLNSNFATTLALPAVPAAPANLLASGISNSKIQVSWNDVSNETSYQLYRSNTTNSNYLLFKTLPANTTSYLDTGLFANSVYYYKVKALNVGGASGFSNEDSAKTINNIPVVTAIPDQYMHFGTQLNVNVTATDLDPEVLNIQVTNLPAFATFTPGSNGTGVINFNNPPTQQVYNNITVTVTDQHSGTSAVSFKLTVNDNYNPVIANINDVTLSEQQTLQVNLSASDQNVSDVLTWSFTGMPAFASVTSNNTTAQITLTPGYADNGPYTVTAKVDDGHNGVATKSFVITVNDVNPNKQVYINFTDGTYTAGTPWNNTNKPTPSLNDNFANLKDENGVNTGIGLLITSPWQNLGNATNTYGVNTGNNSGVYPDNVMRSAYFTDGSVQSMNIYGLNPVYKYNFTFFGSRSGVSDDRTTVYTIGGNSVQLNASSNSQNTVSINNVQSDGSGVVSLTLQKTPAAAYGYLNAMVIQALYDDGTAPAKPRNLSAQFINGNVRLNWIDAAYNEAAYEVYRSTTNQPGSYTLLNPGGNNANLQQYDDPLITGNTLYYYYVRALNNIGSSPNSDTVSITTPNASPLLTAIADVKMKTQEVVDVNVTAVDDPADIITLQVTGLPSFGTFTDNGNGTGTIHLAPGNTIGTFTNITVTATDNHGAASNLHFDITVSDKDITSYYVNFNQVLPVGSPWNSFNSAPVAGASVTNLKDDAGNTSSSSVVLIDGWDGANDVGATTGNNSGVFPDDVMKTAYFQGSASVQRIQITGLTTGGSTKYNLVFFASRSNVNDNRNTTYSYNGQSVTLNAAGNTSNTVQLQGLVPDANGVIEFTAQKASGAAYGYIGALVIQSYFDNGIPIAPSDLVAVPKSNSTIQLSWTDKSNNENGFEIYRSTSLNGTYSLITTTAANVTSYLDQSLLSSTIYYYKVRAKKLPVFFSPYSNIAAASPLSFAVNINFNDDNPAGTPWNNTNKPPISDDVYTNLINTSGNNSGINMTVIGNNFSGVNPYGTITGNNSGIYPDNVIRSTWWLDVGGTATLKIDGLSQAMSYNFVFFASRDGGGNYADRTTVYSIGTRSVSLNAINNISQTVQLSNISPDENGAVFININAGGASPYGYIGALIIQGFSSDHSLPGAAPSNGGANRLVIAGNDEKKDSSNRNNEFAVASRAPIAIVQEAGTNTIKVFPNPFTDDVSVSFSMEKPTDKLKLIVTDLSGRTLFTKDIQNLPQGMSQQKLGIAGKNLPKGIYLVRVVGSEGNQLTAIKIVKQ